MGQMTARDSIRASVLAFPPLPEQHAIAAFLDRETAKIDALVAKKERLIELLQEKRTALISRAVTKGLDLDVPMKDSGVDWLGEIPAHWDVKRLKHLGELQAGAGFPDNEQGNLTQEYPFFKVGDMGRTANGHGMIEWQHAVSSDTARKLRAFILPPSTIVFAKVGAALLLNRRRMIASPSMSQLFNNMDGLHGPLRTTDLYAGCMYWLAWKLALMGKLNSIQVLPDATVPLESRVFSRRAEIPLSRSTRSNRKSPSVAAI